MENSAKGKKKLVLIDGNGLAYRAFYALPPLKTSRGEPMNSVYGFTNMLYQIIEEEKPDYLAVALDKSRPTKRLELFDKYKAHRQKMPEELKQQFPFIEQVVKTLKIPIFWKEGYEADDCIATLTNMAEEKGVFTKIYSGDLDMLQLVSDNTRVVTTRRGISDLIIYDRKMVRKRYGINSPQLVDYKALAGDSSDHIPGIPGIGEASASKLLNQFDRIESMYENPELIPSRWKKQILENRDQAFLSKRLASLEKNLELEFTWEDLKLKKADREELKKLFIRLEFKTMLRKLGFKEEELEEIQEITVMIVGKDEDLIKMLEKLKASKFFSLMWMIEGGELVGLAIAEGDTSGYYFPFILPGHLNISSTFGISTFSRDRICHEMKPHYESANTTKYIYDLKSGIPFIKRGEYFTGKRFFDILIAAYLLQPETPAKNLETILSRFSNFIPKTLDEIITHKKSRKKIKIIEIPLQDLTLFTAGRAVRINNLGPEIEKKLEEADLLEPFFNIEMPVATVLAAMEGRGIKINRVALDNESKKLEKVIQNISTEIYDLVGHVFNINSSKQLGRVLFEGLKLPGAKKTATAYRTGAEILEKIKDEHPIVRNILKYREITKLKSSYSDSIRNRLDPNNGKLHLKFHQNMSSIGRITSSSPNLSNFPVFMKKIFIPSDGDRTLLCFGFCQLEHRILAHLSNDEKMVRAFKENKDIHTEIASTIFNTPFEEVDQEMREMSRTITFGIINGVSAHGLSQKLGIKRAVAKEYINKFLSEFSGVQKFFNDALESVRNTGYVETLLGRKRKLPNINSQNKNMRSQAEKAVIATSILGGTTEIIKKTMIDVFEKIIRNHRDIHILMQVHNELLFETKKRRMEKYAGEIKNLMENTMTMSVPLAVKISEGANWGELEEKTF